MINDTWTSVRTAVKNSERRPDAALKLIRKDGFDANAFDEEHRLTLICEAAHANAPEAVFRALVDAGADPTGKSGRHRQDPDTHETLPAAVPLVVAADKSVEMCATLLDLGADIHEFDFGHLTALMVAAREGRLDIVSFLLERGADINQTTRRGNAFCLAAGALRAETMAFLLSRGADPNVPNRKGETPIQSWSRILSETLDEFSSRDPEIRAFARARPPVLRALTEIDAIPEQDRQKAREVLRRVEEELAKEEKDLIPLGQKQAVAQRSWFTQIKKRIVGASGDRRVLEAIGAKVLATPAAVQHKRWADLVDLLLQQSRAYTDVAEEVYGRRVKFRNDDEGPLADTWATGYYVTVDIVFEHLLAAEAVVARGDWAKLVTKGLKACDTYDFVPQQSIHKALEAGAKHPDYATALQAAESLAKKRNLSREDIVPTR